MMFRVAVRSLLTRPVRAAVLAAGFGFGIAVMAELLGVGQVILEQAHSPALRGGGDLIVYGPFGSVPSARFLMRGVIGAPDLARQVVAASPSRQARVFLMSAEGPVAVSANGGIPSLEQAVGDPEVSGIQSWIDTPADEQWSQPDAGEVIRAMDRFHRIPDAPGRASSWAEWLYFNGRTPDGRSRVYLTFLVGSRAKTPSRRTAGVRLQLEHDGRSRSYSAQAEIDEAALLANAPDLEIGANRVRLEGLRYRMTLALESERSADRLTGEVVLDAEPWRSMPPATIRGANGWVSGYTVPVLAGTMRGALRAGAERVTFEGAAGYHDHNWGFWEGVSWQWGQVAHDDVSIVYGRVFPPADVADPARVPGFLAVLGPGGPLGFSTDVDINDATPGRIDVRATGDAVRLRLTLDAGEAVRTAVNMTRSPGGEPLTFMQLGGMYRVSGTVAGRSIDFTARGSAETFKPR
jgi:hypothetical protein